LGGGSNVLVSDNGVEGLVVLNRARAVSFGTSGVRAQSGALLSTLARQSVARGLKGIEWAVGIPGTLGGAIFGNAGAWDGDMASILVRATILEADGSTSVWTADQFAFAYRSSALKAGAPGVATSTNVAEHIPEWLATGVQHRPIVLDAELALEPEDRAALEERVASIVSRRKASQPPGATCGSLFKNPPGDYAGRLIDSAGLKGRRAGQAQISTVHANFCVNHGDALSSDVMALIDLARETVSDRFGVDLELEIELLGNWTESAGGQSEASVVKPDSLRSSDGVSQNEGGPKGKNVEGTTPNQARHRTPRRIWRAHHLSPIDQGRKGFPSHGVQNYDA
jgi:UDP-N-acetylmuramate dehydrogenase